MPFFCSFAALPLAETTTSFVQCLREPAFPKARYRSAFTPEKLPLGTCPVLLRHIPHSCSPLEGASLPIIAFPFPLGQADRRSSHKASKTNGRQPFHGHPQGMSLVFRAGSARIVLKSWVLLILCQTAYAPPAQLISQLLTSGFSPVSGYLGVIAISSN